MINSKKIYKLFIFLFTLIICTFSLNVNVFSLTAGTPTSMPGGGFPSHTSPALPSHGNAKIAVFMVEFDDIQNIDPAITSQNMSNHLFVNSPTDTNPYGSLTNYYKTSSNGNLNITGEVFGWYKAKKNRAYYDTDEKKEKLITNIINFYSKQGVDFSSFDADSNDVIDGIYLLFAGSADASFFDYTKSADLYIKNIDKNINSYSFVGGTKLSKFIHEAGHQLGVTDYYYNENGSLYYGLGGLDMMDGMIGDHNAFTKLLLGWTNPLPITPNMVNETPTNVVISSSATNHGSVVLFPTNKINYYGKYFVIEYIKPEALWNFSSAQTTFGSGALRIIEVNANVTSDYDSFKQPLKNIVTIVEADNDNSLSSQNNTILSPKDLFSNKDDSITLKLNNELSVNISNFSGDDSGATFSISKTTPEDKQTAKK